jgi:hypothetical protein
MVADGRRYRIAWFDPPFRPPLAETTQALGICFTPEQQIVLVTWNNSQWSLPGGTVEPGETLETDARTRTARGSLRRRTRRHLHRLPASPRTRPRHGGGLLPDALLGTRPIEAVHTRARDDRTAARRSQALPLDALLGRRSHRSPDPRARSCDRTSAGSERLARRSRDPSASLGDANGQRLRSVRWSAASAPAGTSTRRRAISFASAVISGRRPLPERLVDRAERGVARERPHCRSPRDR